MSAMNLSADQARKISDTANSDPRTVEEVRAYTELLVAAIQAQAGNGHYSLDVTHYFNVHLPPHPKPVMPPSFWHLERLRSYFSRLGYVWKAEHGCHEISWY